jgi:hypothetical protein
VVITGFEIKLNKEKKFSKTNFVKPVCDPQSLTFFFFNTVKFKLASFFSLFSAHSMYLKQMV